MAAETPMDMTSKDGFKNSFMGGIIAVFFWLILVSPYLYFTYMPRETFFDYEAIIPHTAQIGKTLEFISVRHVARTAKFESQEDLICRVAGEFKQVKEREISYTSPATNGYADSLSWEYPFVPSLTGECYLEAYIEIFLPFGVKRSQFIVSHFEISN